MQREGNTGKEETAILKKKKKLKGKVSRMWRQCEGMSSCGPVPIYNMGIQVWALKRWVYREFSLWSRKPIIIDRTGVEAAEALGSAKKSPA